MTTKVPKGHPAYAGSAPYNPAQLRFYDPVVLRFANRFLWRCPTDRIVDLYSRNVSGRHLELGPGTGYFLDRCQFPVPDPEITLVDLNSNPLAHTARRIARYRPRTLQADLLEPLDLPPGGFHSVGINYVLHCLPGRIETKAAVLGNLRPLLAPGAVVFGGTILGDGVRHTRLSRRMIELYNRIGAFTNLADDRDTLDRVLGERFTHHRIDVCGAVALFVARTD
ncbi:class I SAM-dependent methyltransferase [Micromonospora cathayae]|uniref:Class I SAM-dependent methyltransferase n=1 Tax=Micromonospora cathayae TaxID=3028804 RepID=A0ABY7ZL28_9ACTN|nr:class I SAM-dependent methyltransferase [Micromonospora sp. HUAS 3]WDZ83578.1 class I SAM-dependent methyltransferase [Micromonospora sp. HUAS 3]